MINYTVRYLSAKTGMTDCDPGAFRRIDKRGMHFVIKSYEIEGVGHLCTMRMKAMLGLMRMESVVLTPYCLDFPLLSSDYIRAAGRNSLFVELYDTQLDPLSEQSVEAFTTLQKRYVSLKDYKEKPHWYDSIRFPQSFAKAGEKTPETYEKVFRNYLKTYMNELQDAPACSPIEKQAKVQAYVDALFYNGGPAVNTMKKLLGAQDTRKLLDDVLFGLSFC